MYVNITSAINNKNMRKFTKTVVSCVICLLFAVTSFAHNPPSTTKNEDPDEIGSIMGNERTSDFSFKKGQHMIHLGLSILNFNYGYGSAYWYGGRSLSIPPLVLAYEYGFHEYFSAGIFGGLGQWRYNWTNNNDIKYTIYTGGLRGTFHYLAFIENELDWKTGFDNTKVDLYFAMHIGARYGTFSDNDGLFSNSTSTSRNRAIFNPVAGIRYMFSDGIGMYGELGYGAFGYFTFGVTGKF